MARKRLPDGRIPVVLSAHADELVRVDARAIADYLDRFPEATVPQVARQLLDTRRLRRHRAVLRAADRLELADGLRALAAGREHPLVATSERSGAARQAFVFPGQGRHWPGMGTVAYRTIPGYRAATDRCAAVFEAAGAESPLRYLTAAENGCPPNGFAEIEVQGAQFVHAVALAEVWRGCGVLPDLTIGQSLGEAAAAYVAGCITLPDAVAVVAARARVVERLPDRYAMATLGVGEQEAAALIAAAAGWAELSVVYSGSTVAVSGDRDTVLAIADAVRTSGRFAREITAGFPGHTSLLERFRDDLLARLPASEFADAPVQFIGGTTGNVVTAGTPFADYWYANLRNTVRLDRAVGSAIRCGAGSFIELSAHPALLFTIGELLESDDSAVLVGSARRDGPVIDTLSANILTAAAADPGHPWGDHLDGAAAGGCPQGFPNAPMRAIPMWAHPEPLPAAAPAPSPGLTTALEQWEPTAPSVPARETPVPFAVIEVGGGGALARRLRAAIESHPTGRLVAPRDAAIVVAAAPALDDTDAVRAADGLTGLIGAGLLDYANAPGPRCHTVCLVTAGAERVGTRDAAPSAGHAALAAMHRSIGFDHPERAFTHLDLPSQEASPAAGPDIVAALLSGAGASALRDFGAGFALFERAFRDAAAASQPPFDPAVLDDVVITGGSGAVGLHYARYLAAHGARRIVLLSRRPADPHVLAALADRYGTELVAAPCDLTDPAQLSLIAGEYGGGGATLIVHAAGTATFGAAVTAAAVAETFAAKVKGLTHLAELWPVRPDARTLLCSSVSGLWGGRGHVAYSAANRLLDVIAARLRADGRHCVSVRWGLWGPTDGESRRSMADSADIADIERSGLRPMAPHQAIEASLRDWHGDPLLFAADTDRLRIFLDSNRSGAPVEDGGSSDVAGPDPADAPVPVVEAVRGQLAAVLGVAQPGRIDLDESLFDLGIDSMLALDLRKRLQRTIGRTVSLATLMGEITGTELVDKLEGADARADSAQKVARTRD